jgi:hypothetical protein
MLITTQRMQLALRRSSLQENDSLFLSFPYVCPEPVLVNILRFCAQMAQTDRFHIPSRRNPRTGATPSRQSWHTSASTLRKNATLFSELPCVRPEPVLAK